MKTNGWRIISLEASEIYKQIKNNGMEVGYQLPNKKDFQFFHLFKNVFDYSLDAIELEKAYTKICRKKFAGERKSINDIPLIKASSPEFARLPPDRGAVFACILSFKRAKRRVSQIQSVR